MYAPTQACPCTTHLSFSFSSSFLRLSRSALHSFCSRLHGACPAWACRVGQGSSKLWMCCLPPYNCWEKFKAGKLRMHGCACAPSNRYPEAASLQCPCWSLQQPHHGLTF